MKNYCCNECDLSFTYPSLLQRHHRIHTKEKLFKCHHCSKSFTRADTLKTHINIHSHKGFMCCGKILHSRASLKYHIKTYHVLKCPLCDCSFESSKFLFAHISQHLLQKQSNRIKMQIQTASIGQNEVKVQDISTL